MSVRMNAQIPTSPGTPRLRACGSGGVLFGAASGLVVLAGSDAIVVLLIGLLVSWYQVGVDVSDFRNRLIARPIHANAQFDPCLRWGRTCPVCRVRRRRTAHPSRLLRGGISAPAGRWPEGPDKS